MATNLNGRLTRLERLAKPGPAWRVADRRDLDGKPGLVFSHGDRVVKVITGIDYDDI